MYICQRLIDRSNSFYLLFKTVFVCRLYHSAKQKKLTMKKRFITLLFVVFNGLGLSAQTTYAPKCTMTIDEIALAQPYHRDHPNQEETERIARVFMTEIAAAYTSFNNKQLSEINAHKNTIQLAVEQALAMGMNYTMFKEDIDFIEAIKN